MQLSIFPSAAGLHQNPKSQMSTSMENTEQLQLQQEPQLNYITETVLKKRKSSEEWALRRKQQLLERKWQRKQDNKEDCFKRAEHFIQEYRSKELDLVKMKYRSKRRKTDVVSSGSKLLFVIRIQCKNGIHPKIQKILGTLGLRRVFSGVFVKASEGTMAMLQKVEPYVTYGYPDLKKVTELVYKKGHLKVGKQRIPLTDNNIIEQTLGKHGILCIEDIINEIVNVGPNFKEVVHHLWPIVLEKPQGDVLQGKKNPFNKGGDSGNREVHINELINKMN